ncbi:MAG: alpha/beta fold hydrolase [Vulcanimicrobiaceae bacterium]
MNADDAENIAQRNRRAEQLEQGDLQSLRIESMFGNPVDEEPQGLRERVEAMALANSPRALAQMLRGLALRDASFDIAEELDIPVLCIAGRRDHVVPEHDVTAMAAAFPRASVQWCERSGHLAPMEEPERVSELLREFLDLR